MFDASRLRRLFRDKRVRRAVALLLNRPDIIKTRPPRRWDARKRLAVRSGFPSTDPSIKQRRQNLALARALLQAAGQENLATITTHNQFDVPDFATAVQASGRQAGIEIDLNVMTYDDYYSAVGGGDYDTTTPGSTRRRPLPSTARGVPNLYLTAAYVTGGIWNASKYSNSDFDSAARTYLGSAEIGSPAQGDEAHGRLSAARHSGDHGVLPQLRRRGDIEGAELPGGRDLVHPCRQDLARIEEKERAAGA